MQNWLFSLKWWRRSCYWKMEGVWDRVSMFLILMFLATIATTQKRTARLVRSIVCLCVSKRKREREKREWEREQRERKRERESVYEREKRWRNMERKEKRICRRLTERVAQLDVPPKSVSVNAKCKRRT